MEAEASVKLFDSKIKKLCAEYLGNEWKTNNESIIIQRILSGVINRTFSCTLNCGGTQKNVIVKFYGSEALERAKEMTGNDLKGGSECDWFNCEASEAVIIERLSANGMAPKIYGLFRGGRIEEFIDGRNPQINDFADKSLFSTIAVNLAKYHSFKMPVPKIPDWINLFINLIQMIPEPKDYSEIPTEYLSHVKKMFEIDLAAEFKWTRSLEEKVNSKLVFSHNDLHMYNMLLRNEYKSPEQKIVFVDYEGSACYYRGYDMAYFFNSFEFHAFGGVEKMEIKYTGRKCDDEAIRIFAEQYLSKMREIGSIDEEIDTTEHLLMEIDFFKLQVYLVFLFISRSSCSDSKWKNPFNHISALLNSYDQHKSYVLSKYANTLNEDFNEKL